MDRAERGFEPSKGLYAPFSLSRRAPSTVLGHLSRERHQVSGIEVSAGYRSLRCPRGATHLAPLALRSAPGSARGVICSGGTATAGHNGLGGMAERTKATVLKTVEPLAGFRGFESYPPLKKMSLRFLLAPGAWCLTFTGPRLLLRQALPGSGGYGVLLNRTAPSRPRCQSPAPRSSSPAGRWRPVSHGRS